MKNPMPNNTPEEKTYGCVECRLNLCKVCNNCHNYTCDDFEGKQSACLSYPLERDMQNGHTANFLEVGQRVACGHCEPDKYAVAPIPCNCKCHAHQPDSMEWEKRFDEKFRAGTSNWWQTDYDYEKTIRPDEVKEFIKAEKALSRAEGMREVWHKIGKLEQEVEKDTEEAFDLLCK